MAAHSIQRVQVIPCSIEEAWAFFSNPANLARITPQGMDFRVLSPQPLPAMYPGQLIEYRVKPMLGISVYWMTEITHVVNGRYFVDEQRFGPYRFWHHQHHFREVPGGVEMTDIVHYRNPLGFLGRIANRLFIQSKLKAIFDYRVKAVEEHFGVWKAE